ncbi:MAG: hypothetical protein ABII07_03030 [Patescibacteria group bacterium]|nr:hypothetical protein [Patescibacteria group bacterium]
MATESNRGGDERIIERARKDHEIVNQTNREGVGEMIRMAEEDMVAEAEELGITVDELRARTTERAHVASSSSRVHSGGMGNGMPGNWRYGDWLTRFYPAGIPPRESEESTEG